MFCPSGISRLQVGDADSALDCITVFSNRPESGVKKNGFPTETLRSSLNIEKQPSGLS